MYIAWKYYTNIQYTYTSYVLIRAYAYTPSNITCIPPTFWPSRNTRNDVQVPNSYRPFGSRGGQWYAPAEPIENVVYNNNNCV